MDLQRSQAIRGKKQPIRAGAGHRNRRQRLSGVRINWSMRVRLKDSVAQAFHSCDQFSRRAFNDWVGHVNAPNLAVEADSVDLSVQCALHCTDTALRDDE